VFPNPTSKKVIIESEERIVRYEIYDVNSNLLRTGDKAGKRFVIDVQDGLGVLVLKLFTTEDHWLVKKLIVK